MTNPSQLLCNVLEECGLSNTADVAAKLIDEEVSWNDITEAHGSRGDIGVHNLLNGIVKTGGRAKIVKYLDQAQENAASSGAGGHMGGSSGGSSSSSASSTTSEKVTLAITVMQGLKTLIPRRAVTVSREMTFAELAASVVDEDAEAAEAVADRPLMVKMYPNANYRQQDGTSASLGDKIGPSSSLGYSFLNLIYQPQLEVAPQQQSVIIDAIVFVYSHTFDTPNHPAFPPTQRRFNS